MIYLSGPISGPSIKENLERMNQKAQELRGLGFTLFNPAELESEQARSWYWYMARDIIWIFLRTLTFRKPVFYFLKNWRKSRGARVEHKIATIIGAHKFYEE